MFLILHMVQNRKSPSTIDEFILQPLKGRPSSNGFLAFDAKMGKNRPEKGWPGQFWSQFLFVICSVFFCGVFGGSDPQLRGQQAAPFQLALNFPVSELDPLGVAM